MHDTVHRLAQLIGIVNVSVEDFLLNFAAATSSLIELGKVNLNSYFSSTYSVMSS